MRKSSPAFAGWVLHEGGAEFELLAKYVQYHLWFSRRIMGRGGVHSWGAARWRAFLGRHGGEDAGRLVLLIDLAERRFCRHLSAAECVPSVDAVNDPRAYNALPFSERFHLLAYCLAHFEAARRAHPAGSYQLKHELERGQGVYFTNGQFAGALLCAGLAPVDEPGPTQRFKMRRRALR